MSKTYTFLTEEDFDNSLDNDIKKNVSKVIYKYIYKDIVKILKQGKVIKKKEQIINSIQEDIIFDYLFNKKTIYYQDGGFQGSFNSKISKALKDTGAVWNKNNHSWDVNRYQLSQSINNIIDKQQETRNTLEKFINVGVGAMIGLIMTSQLDKKDYTKRFSDIRQTLSEKVTTSTNLQDNITNPFTKQLADTYNREVKYYINNMVKEEIDNLRNDVQRIIKEGGSLQDIQDRINNRYNINLNRADFIAKQEKRLFVTKYQQEFFKSNNQTNYKWVHRTPFKQNDRDVHIQWHKESAKGRIFSFNNPAYNPKSQETENPGEAFNCRCKAQIVY